MACRNATQLPQTEVHLGTRVCSELLPRAQETRRTSRTTRAWDICEGGVDVGRHLRWPGGRDGLQGRLFAAMKPCSAPRGPGPWPLNMLPSGFLPGPSLSPISYPGFTS